MSRGSMSMMEGNNNPASPASYITRLHSTPIQFSSSLRRSRFRTQILWSLHQKFKRVKVNLIILYSSQMQVFFPISRYDKINFMGFSQLHLFKHVQHIVNS